MNCKRIVTALLISGIIAALSGFARMDDDPLSKIITQLEKWHSSHPQEKVYLQFDKPYYSAGDDIWFKAYITIGAAHKLSGLSKALNIDLIDDKDSVKQSIKLPAFSGFTWGNFALPDTMRAGNYRIRAYTNWMRNAGSEYFFDKTIAVTNSVTTDVFTHTTYRYNNQNGRQQVNAVISYSHLDGKPYANRPVSYEVQLGARIISSGSGQTDDKGNLNLAFSASPHDAPAGHIITALKVDGKKPVKKIILIKAARANTDVQFFPEGGNLVNNNETKIGFKAVGADGLGANISGTVVDDRNNQVCIFSAGHAGMGVFTLKPEDGRSYKAKITYADGSQGTFDLPAATSNGYTLSVDNSDANTIHVKILPGAVVSAGASQNEVMNLVAQGGGTIYYAGKSKPGSKFFYADVPKNKFPSGIVQFTLFSSTGEPLNERLVFIQRHDQLKLDVVDGRPVYSPRQKVKIDLHATDKDGQPVIGSFSAAVTDETKVPVDGDAENSILSTLLLTSDLRGYVEKPNYYFNNESDKTRADLDVLMLTQGYHRFEWKEVLSGNYPPAAYQPEKALQISGRLKTLFGKPVANGKVALFSTQGGIFMVDTTADEDGKFTFENLIFRDSVRFVIQARTAKNRKNVQVFADSAPPVPSGENKNAPDFMVNFDNNLSPFLQSSKMQYDTELKYGLINSSIMLKEVEVKDKKEQPLKTSSNLNGAGNADQVILAKDVAMSGCATIGDCLQGRLSGVVFRNDTPYLIRNLNRPMLIVLDGVYVDGPTLSNITPTEIESVEVLKSIGYTAIYGGRGGGGVLVVTTKTGNSAGSYERYSPGLITYMPKGYAKVREFYAPRYDDPKTNVQIPDLRSTICWKPNIVTDKDGKASFDYFNADGKGTYRVVIEGIDSNGSLGRLVYRYKVE